MMRLLIILILLAAPLLAQDNMVLTSEGRVQTGRIVSGEVAGAGFGGLYTLTITRTGGGGTFEADSTKLDSVLQLALDSLDNIGGGSIGIAGGFALTDTTFLRTSNVSLRGEPNTTRITITVPYYAIVDTAGADGIRIDGIRWKGTAGALGVFKGVTGTDTLIFQNNVVSNFTSSSATVFGSDSSALYWQVKDNVFTNCYTVQIKGAYSSFTDNFVTNPGQAQPAVDVNTTATRVQNNTIRIKGLTANSGIGIQAQYYGHPNMQNTLGVGFMITGNNISFRDTSAANIGILIPNAAKANILYHWIISNNEVQGDSTGYNKGVGIRVIESTQRGTMDGNNITHFATGIDLQSAAHGVAIRGGTIRNMGTESIKIAGSYNVVIGVNFYIPGTVINIAGGSHNGYEALNTQGGSITDNGTNTHAGATSGIIY